MSGQKNQTELGTEALISVNKATFSMILATPRDHLVDTLHDLIRKGHLIIWNPSRSAFIRDGDILSARIQNGRTVKITLVAEKKLDIEAWCES